MEEWSNGASERIMNIDQGMMKAEVRQASTTSYFYVRHSLLDIRYSSSALQSSITPVLHLSIPPLFTTSAIDQESIVANNLLLGSVF